MLFVEDDWINNVIKNNKCQGTKNNGHCQPNGHIAITGYEPFNKPGNYEKWNRTDHNFKSVLCAFQK
jgi:hypothetical protein